MKSIIPVSRFKMVPIDLDVGLRIGRELMKKNRRTLKLLEKM